MSIYILAFLLSSQIYSCAPNLACSFAQQQPASDTSIRDAPPKSSVASDVGWMPSDVDSNVPPVELDPPCDPEVVLKKAGERVQEFVENVQRFTATESLLHESINKAGAVVGTEHRKYEYMVSIEEFRPGLFDVEESLRNGATPIDYPGGRATRGLPALILIFHPLYAENFYMTCEGLGTLNGKKAWQVYFRQRTDKPNKIRSYRIGSNGPSHPVDLKGRAWFLADTYQLAALQTDLMHSVREIQLVAEHTVIDYVPVHFVAHGVDMCVPRTAEVYSDWKGKRIHRRLSFSDYLLFAVDEREKISAPTPIPVSP